MKVLWVIVLLAGLAFSWVAGRYLMGGRHVKWLVGAFWAVFLAVCGFAGVILTPTGVLTNPDLTSLGLAAYYAIGMTIFFRALSSRKRAI